MYENKEKTGFKEMWNCSGFAAQRASSYQSHAIKTKLDSGMGELAPLTHFF